MSNHPFDSDAELLKTGLALPIISDIALGIDAHVTISNLVSMGMTRQRAAHFVTSVADLFKRLPEPRREGIRQNLKNRLEVIRRGLSSGAAQPQLIKEEMEVQHLTRMQAAGIVNYAMAVHKPRLGQSPAPSQILADIPKMAETLLARGDSPAKTAELLAKQWNCSLDQAQALMDPGKWPAQPEPLPVPAPVPAPKPAAREEPAATFNSSGPSFKEEPAETVSSSRPAFEEGRAEPFFSVDTPVGIAEPARELARPKKPARKKGNKLVGCAVVALLLLLALYPLSGMLLASPVHKAYAAHDYQAVVQSASRFKSFYPSFITGSLNAEFEECSTYLSAETFWINSDWQHAYEQYRRYSDSYPQGILIGEARARASKSLLSWSQAQVASREYAGAIANLQMIVKDFPELPEAPPAQEVLPQIYLDYGLALAGAGQFQAAVDTLTLLSEQYTGSEQAEAARLAIPQVYSDWALALAAEGSFSEAEARFKLALQDGGSTRERSLALLPGFYQSWANALVAEGRFSDALVVYESSRQLLSQETLATADQGQTGVLLAWSSDLEAQQDYLAALEKIKEARASAGAPLLASDIDSRSQSVLGAFSASTGEQALTAMEAAATGLCQSGSLPEGSPAIFGLDPEKVLMYLFPRDSVLGADPSLLAATPGAMHYVLCVEPDKKTIQTCPYQKGYSLVREQRMWKVQLYDASDGKPVAKTQILGEVPDTCPPTKLFSMGNLVQIISGPMPTYAELQEWFLPKLK